MSSREALEVRPAAPGDAAVIVNFNCRLVSESEAKHLDADVVARGVAALLADPTKGRYFIALRGSQTVGQLMITYEWSDWRDGNIWWLQSVYVVAEARRQGVFRALMNHVLAAAEADPEAIGLRLYVEDNNLVAQDTYRNLGFAPAPYRVMQRLGGGD